jgi:hypothetical protein
MVNNYSAVNWFLNKSFKRILIIILFAGNLFCGKECFAQLQNINGGKIFHFSSSSTSFPETLRLNGYKYDSQFYDYKTHYNDSSVLIVVPDKLKIINNKVDIVFWFHGWHNNIDTALSYYHLTEQFIASNKNAILVLAETGKNVPDSYGGKLEKQNVFKELVNDVLKNLQKNKTVAQSCKAGNIVLAGHSGAYRVIAYILQNGGEVVNEVNLFDALYSETDKFTAWIKKDTNNKFINFYTNTGGGTDKVSIKMMDDLKVQKTSFLFTEENNINNNILRSAKIIFIHSTRQHNDIIFNPDNFRSFLESSTFITSIKN